MDGYMDGRTDGWTDRQMGGWSICVGERLGRNCHIFSLPPSLSGLASTRTILLTALPYTLEELHPSPRVLFHAEQPFARYFSS